MKFMKVGSLPDTFHTTDGVRSISSEISSDLVIEVHGTTYLLHKFPLLSKCLKLQKLSLESTQHQILQLPDFPGGPSSFEFCAKFCYGITITISAYNFLPARFAAEYLEMTEDVEKGNLIYKLETFFTSCILNGWKDTLVTLQSTKLFQSWSEELGITNRCIEAIASKVLSTPSKVNLSQRGEGRDDISWWGEDLSKLEIDLYWRTMIAIKSVGKVSSDVVGDALRIYACKWLPKVSRNLEIGSDSDGDSSFSDSKSRMILESIISLLPNGRNAVSFGLLVKLLKSCMILRGSSSSRTELERRIGIQLDQATVGDLLILSSSIEGENTHDVDIVLNVLEEFMVQSQSQSPPTSPPRVKGGHRRSRSTDTEFQERRRSSSGSHSSKIKVAMVVDEYLEEIAKDVNLPLSKFIALTEAVPDFVRLGHDDLYRAIDIYLKSHPNLTKSERKHLCGRLDCKKLSLETCMHAAQNEQLPLRVLVQVLFTERSRATGRLPRSLKALMAAENNASGTTPAPGFKSLNPSLSGSKKKYPRVDVMEEEKVKQLCSIPSRPKRMLTKLLWPIGGNERC